MSPDFANFTSARRTDLSLILVICASQNSLGLIILQRWKETSSRSTAISPGLLRMYLKSGSLIAISASPQSASQPSSSELLFQGCPGNDRCCSWIGTFHSRLNPSWRGQPEDSL